VVIVIVTANPGISGHTATPYAATRQQASARREWERPPHPPTRLEVTMNSIRHLVYILGGLALSVLALGSAPAFAEHVPPPGAWGNPLIGPLQIARPHLVAVGGMPGWQITLIAVGAALLAATVAVILDWARTARRHAAANIA
jgi:hypothetical protein